MNPDNVSAQVPDIADGVSESTKASTTEVQTTTSRKKTNAQRCREYRERKKLQNTMVQNITAERSDECSETDQLQAKKPKTNAERRKKHYEAQKLKKQESKKIPKTVKQRNKEYYERKKKNQALNTLNHHSDAKKNLQRRKNQTEDTETEDAAAVGNLRSELRQNTEDGAVEAGSSYWDVPMETEQGSTTIYAQDTSASDGKETLVLVIKEEAEDFDYDAAEDTQIKEEPVEPEVNCETIEPLSVGQECVDDPYQTIPKADPDHIEQLKTALDPLVTHLKEQYEYVTKKRLQEKESYKKELDECHRVIKQNEKAHKCQIEQLKKENAALLEEIKKLKGVLPRN